MRIRLYSVLFGIVGCLLAAAAPAADWAWLMSIPHARSGEAVYKVRIAAIDGVPQQELLRYALAGGSHTVTVELMLDMEWEPDLSTGPQGPAIKQLRLDATPGKSYFLAGQVKLDAPIEAQLDHSWWEPVVYEVR
jgi:hypothetical protein